MLIVFRVSQSGLTGNQRVVRAELVIVSDILSFHVACFDTILQKCTVSALTAMMFTL